MSAFLCSARHTWAVAILAARHGLADDPQSAAFMLRALNNAALRDRYDAPAVPLPGGEAGRDAVRAAEAWLATHSPRDVALVAACLRYQCAEGDFESRPGWATLDTLCDKLTATASRAPDGARDTNVWSI
jgi:hypothetical protein